jgi:hypothetical protein
MEKPEGIRIEFGGDGVTLDDILAQMRVVTFAERRAYAIQFLLKLSVLGIENVYGDEDLQEKSDAADSVLAAMATLTTHEELAAAMEHVRQELKE